MSRFTSALLDGRLPSVLSAGIPSERFYVMTYDVLLAFTTTDWDGWSRYSSGLSPADAAMAHLGSTLDTTGMVVADSSLNSIKSMVCYFPRIL